MPIDAHFFRRSILTLKWVILIWLLMCNQGSLVSLCTQDYKSLYSGYDLCATLVNTKTHRQTYVQKIFDQLIRIAQPAEIKTDSATDNTASHAHQIVFSFGNINIIWAKFLFIDL